MDIWRLMTSMNVYLALSIFQSSLAFAGSGLGMRWIVQNWDTFMTSEEWISFPRVM